jgi:hypothetical protein
MTAELWTWERCGPQILTLKNRLGFSDEICFLKYCIKEDGTIYDSLHETTIVEHKIMYWILTHYSQAHEFPLTNELIPYDKLPGGYAYFGAFRRFAIDPLLNAFGDKIESLERSSLFLGGKSRSFGDISFQISVLPLIPITIVLWERTEEFPPRLSILYDTSASSYLPTEDLAHVGELLSDRLIEVKRCSDD